ncbi:MAG TPA: hypothetical protein VGL39_18860 [Jatrophihabitantaceae bacterium]|jgi:hypothetical protein
MRIRHPHGDDGATLVVVLIIVTVIGAVLGVTLSQADTSVRTTVVLRDQAASTYAGDAAGQAAVAQLQNGKLSCATPATTAVNFGSGGSPFYQPVSTVDGPRNASATCAPDTSPDSAVTTTTTSGSGVGIGGGDDNLPSYALLAMERNTLSEGITFPQSNKTICIENGRVASNAAVNITNNVLGVRLTGTGSAGDCSTGSGTGLSVQAYGVNGAGGCQPATGNSFRPTPCTALPTPIGMPTAPAPPSGVGAPTPSPVCGTNGGTKYAAFVPGKYTDVSVLNSPCSGGATFEWFSPGTYYFDYGSTPWQWPTTLVAGTPTSGPSVTNADGSVTTPAITGVTPTNANSLTGLAGVPSWPSSSTQHPAACADPSTQKQYPGVEFVFGGTSTFTPNSGGNAEVCGTYSDAAPPIAIYGTSSSSDVPGMSAQKLCVSGATAVTCSTATPTANGTLINTTASGQAQFYVKGFVYAPTAPISLNVKNSNGQIFNWGVVVWTFSLNVNGTSPTAPFIQLPSPNQGFTQTTTTTYSVRYLNIWTCAASATPCARTGPPDLRVKVQTSGSAIKVLSWSR